MLKNTMIKQPTEEDPDEGIKDLVETMVKKMVRLSPILRKSYLYSDHTVLYISDMVSFIIT